jgi:hypothetical protein
MKRTLILVATAAFLGLVSTGANAAGPNGYKSTDGGNPTAGLAWRCGKNNPAMWGTFGNGCLKQKRKAKQNSNAAQLPTKAFVNQQ